MFKKLFKKDEIVVRKYKPIFTTIDNVKHEGPEYNWIIVNRLRCQATDYIMIDIKSDGYIKDNNGIMYILSNVISIDWQVAKEAVVKDKYHEYQVYISTLAD